MGFGLYMGGTERLGGDGEDEAIVNDDGSSIYIPEDAESEEDIPFENSQAGKRAGKRPQSADIVPEESPKKFRVHGGKAPVAKRVTEDYDSDDACIIELKNQGYTDAQVCDKLAKDGHTRYVPKTITSRYTRLKKITDQKLDDQLDDELSDWHLGEDDDLEESLKAVEEKFELEMAKLMEKKWQTVSHKLAERLSIRKYTAKACKERWDALQDGSALKPIEIDSDQENRRIMREKRIADARRNRAAEHEEARRIQEAKDARAREKKELKLQKYNEKLEAEKAKAGDKAETRRLQEERKRGKEKKKAALKEVAALWKAEIDEVRRVRELEERIYRHITGKNLRRIRRSTAFHEDDADDGDSQFDSDDDEEEAGADVSDDSEASSMEITTAPKAKVTSRTLANPRSVLTDGELEVLLHARALPRRGARESHARVVARIAANDAQLSSDQLSALLIPHFDKGRGSKVAKARRLAQYDADKSEAGKAGVKATDREFKKGYEGYVGRFAALIDVEEEEN